MLKAPASLLVGSQVPRVRSVPDGSLGSLGVEAVEVAERAGLVLDEWQRDVLVDAARVRADGNWAAFQVAVLLSRQNGKGAIEEARELAGLFAWGERLITHTAHQFDTSLEAFWRLLNLIESVPEFDSQVKRVSRSHGEEGITLRSGQRIRFRTRTKVGGRGFSGDLLIFDEAMAISQFGHGTLLPILSAQPNPQVWYLGSAVDQQEHDHGVVFAGLRERGHAGGDKSLAWFEWSLDFDSPGEVPDEVAEDVGAWALANPALGIRIRSEYIDQELAALDARSFAVERLGVGDWPSTDGIVESPVGMLEWLALVDKESLLEDPVCLAFDVSPDRRASIAAAGRRSDGLLHVEVVEQRPGTKWLPDRLVELVESHEPFEIVCDGYGPAASVLKAVVELGVQVRTLSGQEHAQACGQLVDRVGEKQVRHLGSSEIQQALRGARTRPLGDAWAWSRKNSTVDISPLVAATLALSAAAGMPDDVTDPVIF